MMPPFGALARCIIAERISKLTVARMPEWSKGAHLRCASLLTARVQSVCCSPLPSAPLPSLTPAQPRCEQTPSFGSSFFGPARVALRRSRGSSFASARVAPPCVALTRTAPHPPIARQPALYELAPLPPPLTRSSRRCRSSCSSRPPRPSPGPRSRGTWSPRGL